MKIRSFLAAVILAVLILPASLCAAEVTDEDMALGGIRIGMTTAEVEDLYGAPEDTEDRMEGSRAVRTYDYGDTFRVKFQKAEDAGYAVSMVFLGVNGVNEYSIRPTARACSFETPRGIHLDNTREDLAAAYGYLPEPKCSHNAPPVCGYFYEGETAKLGFYICAGHSPGIRSIWLTVK